MGFYTVVVFNNDCIHELDRDPEIGKRIHEACLRAQIRDYQPVPIHGRGCCVGEVVEQQHADTLSVMSLSIGSGAKRLGYGLWGDDEEALIRRLAEDRGYTLRRKPGARSARKEKKR